MTIAHVFSIIIAILAFAPLLMFIVFFHEYGHFSVARMLGIRVDTFSIGFGKPLVSWMDKKGTEWRIATIPLGGYVKFFGDLNAASQPNTEALGEPNDGDEPSKPVTTQFPSGNRDELARGMTAEERKVCFHFKPVWARALVVAAGPFANFLLSIVIFASLFMLLGRNVAAPVVGAVQPDSAAEEAGFIAGDRILSVNGRAVAEFGDIQNVVMLSTGEALAIEIDRQGERLMLTATPRRTEIEDGFGNKQSTGLLGIRADGTFTSIRYGPIGAVQQATKSVWNVISTTVRFIGRLIVGKESADMLGGPVKMAKYAGQAASSGFDERLPQETSFPERLRISLTTMITLAAFMSVSIGFLNLLPIPVLDGGHLVYYAIEGVFGKPLGPRVQAIGYQIGLVLLVSFMLFVTWNDISGLITSSFTSNG